MTKRFGAILLLAALITSAASANAQPLPTITVKTIAGSGAIGFADGVADEATFLMPLGLAYDSHGNLYIADAGAQRIRVLHANGTVTTLAGGGSIDPAGPWVMGGYRDATGTAARFNRPTGVAVDAKGNVYVADSNNHCIRKIDTRGRVTTFAGSARKSGKDDGYRTNATFGSPTGIAIDAYGDIYVADPQTLIRKIDVHGNVTTILVGTAPLGVAVIDSAAGPHLFAAGIDALAFKSPKVLIDYPSAEHRRSGDPFLQGYKLMGDAFAVAFLDPSSAVYTDPRTNTVRYLNRFLGETRIIAGQSPYDASGDTGAFKDGLAETSYFNGPTGIAVDRHGNVVVADTGNRRIRSIGPIVRRRFVVASNALLPTASAPKTYNIAFLGNSYVWQNAEWDDSIEAVMERRLSADNSATSLHASNLRPSVVPIGVGSIVSAAGEYLRGVNAISHSYDAVVLDINEVNVAETFHIPEDQVVARAAEWSGPLTSQIRRLNEDLAAHSTPLIVVTHPMPYELSPTEGAWMALFQPTMEPNARVGELINAALQASGAQVVDLWPRFVATESATNRPPLFMSEDPHPTAYGRSVIAEGVADALERLHPWVKR